jgi:hypothetical protein
MYELLVPQSPGDVLDRLVILELKCKRLTGEKAELANIERKAVLHYWNQSRFSKIPIADSDIAELEEVNAYLWSLEDNLRALEKAQATNTSMFIGMARQVYLTNDRRAAIKRRINAALGSKIVEVKSYA